MTLENPAELSQNRTPTGIALRKLAQGIHPALNIWFHKTLQMHVVGFMGILTELDFANLMTIQVDLSDSNWASVIVGDDGELTLSMRQYCDKVGQLHDDLVAGLHVIYEDCKLYPQALKLQVYPAPLKDRSVAEYAALRTAMSYINSSHTETDALPEDLASFAAVMVSSRLFGSFYGVAALKDVAVPSGTKIFSRQLFLEWAADVKKRQALKTSLHRERVNIIKRHVMKMTEDDWDTLLNERPEFAHKFIKRLELYNK